MSIGRELPWCSRSATPNSRPEHTIFTHDRTWLPIGLTAVAALFLNISFLLATTAPISAAALAPTSAGAVRAVPAEQPAIDAASVTARERLDAAAESAARAPTQHAAGQATGEQAAIGQAAAEQHAASPTNESTPTPTPTPAANHHARAERVADAMPFDWRANGITFKVGCHPDQDRCAWGTFDHRVDEVWLSSAAFRSDARLRYVVAHEVAHAWQWSTNLDDREADLIDFGVSTSDGIEYGADCVAAAWGYPVATYWDCPPDAVAHMRSVLAATT